MHPLPLQPCSIRRPNLVAAFLKLLGSSPLIKLAEHAACQRRALGASKRTCRQGAQPLWNSDRKHQHQDDCHNAHLRQQVLLFRQHAPVLLLQHLLLQCASTDGAQNDLTRSQPVSGGPSSCHFRCPFVSPCCIYEKRPLTSNGACLLTSTIASSKGRRVLLL